MSKRIVLLVTLEDTGEQTPPLDPPTVDAVRAEIQANLESIWPSACILVEDAGIAEVCLNCGCQVSAIERKEYE